MLATGGTLAVAIRYLVDRGADDITAICLLAAPEGVERLEAAIADLHVPVTDRDRRRWTSGSTTTATSSPASVTPATASTASSEPRPAPRGAPAPVVPARFGRIALRCGPIRGH